MSKPGAPSTHQRLLGHHKLWAEHGPDQRRISACSAELRTCPPPWAQEPPADRGTFEARSKCAQTQGAACGRLRPSRAGSAVGNAESQEKGVIPGSHGACTGATGSPPLSSAVRTLKEVGPPRSSRSTRPDPQRQKEHLEGNAGNPAASAASLT